MTDVRNCKGAPIINKASPSKNETKKEKPEISGGFRRLPKMPDQRLPEITGDYQKLPEITGGYRRLPEVTRDYRRFPASLSNTSPCKNSGLNQGTTSMRAQFRGPSFSVTFQGTMATNHVNHLATAEKDGA